MSWPARSNGPGHNLGSPELLRFTPQRLVRPVNPVIVPFRAPVVQQVIQQRVLPSSPARFAGPVVRAQQTPIRLSPLRPNSVISPVSHLRPNQQLLPNVGAVSYSQGVIRPHAQPAIPHKVIQIIRPQGVAMRQQGTIAIRPQAIISPQGAMRAHGVIYPQLQRIQPPTSFSRLPVPMGLARPPVHPHAPQLRQTNFPAHFRPLPPSPSRPGALRTMIGAKTAVTSSIVHLIPPSRVKRKGTDDALPSATKRPKESEQQAANDNKSEFEASPPKEEGGGGGGNNTVPEAVAATAEEEVGAAAGEEEVTAAGEEEVAAAGEEVVAEAIEEQQVTTATTEAVVVVAENLFEELDSVDGGTS